MIRKRITFIGHVQGVGFRYTTARIAANYQVTGYVRNLSNGNVEMTVEGKTQVVNAFIDHLNQEMGSYIRESKLRNETYINEFDNFTIRY